MMSIRTWVAIEEKMHTLPWASGGTITRLATLIPGDALTTEAFGAGDEQG